MHLLTCRSIKAPIINHRSASGGRPNFPGPNHPKAEPSWGQTNERPTQPQTEPSRGRNILRPNHREAKPTGGQTIQRPNHAESEPSWGQIKQCWTRGGLISTWHRICIFNYKSHPANYSSVDLMVLY